jgi:hypothetical protein
LQVDGALVALQHVQPENKLGARLLLQHGYAARREMTSDLLVVGLPLQRQIACGTHVCRVCRVRSTGQII